MSLLKGKESLIGYRLNSKSPTRRVVAACCNSLMFLEFQNGHWLSIYGERFEKKDQPPIEISTMTEDRGEDVKFSDDTPSPKTHSFKFMWKLFSAWMFMGFKSPPTEVDNERALKS